MEKRKSTGTDGGDVRASKRLKTVEDKNPDSLAATTKTGLEFLEQIRKTGDKNGRRIANHFETLPPRKGNEDYYKRIRMPISLQNVEAKLGNSEFESMSELESYVKRMVQNAKDYYPKGSQAFDDAERVRKATSNFMVRHNPAYKLQHGYSAVPTPIPDHMLESDGDADADGDDDADAAGEDDADADADGDADDAEADAEGDEDAEGDDDDEDEENDDEDDEDDEPTSSARRKSSSARSARDTPGRPGRKSSERAVSVSVKQDYEYAGVPYVGLTFQQAQEKIVEEVVRRPDEEDESYAYFEPFLNLPSRALKDYFQVIKDPLSLKKLQKLVKGIRSRTDRPGVTEFKSWAAFEDKASLLWENALFYNEDGSPIANMARELEKTFRDELRQAKEVVQEPPQPKIKIKKASASGQGTPVAGSKKITIHVANTRGSSVESPAPKTGGSASSDAAGVGALRGVLPTPSALDKARSLSSNASPSPSVAAALVGAKREASSRASPALLPQRPNGIALAAGAGVGPGAGAGLANGSPAAGTPVNGSVVAASGAPAAAATNGEAAAPPAPPAPVVPPRPPYESKFREPGSEPLVTNLVMRTNQAIPCGDRRFEIRLPPHPRLSQRSITLNIPAGQWRQNLVLSMQPAIAQRLRSYKLYVISNGATLGQTVPSPTAAPDPAAAPAEAGAVLFEINLHPGVNVIQVHLIAGLAKGQTLPSGGDAELDKVMIFANLMKA